MAGEEELETKVFRSVDSGGDTAQEVGRGGLLITVGEFSSAHSSVPV